MAIVALIVFLVIGSFGAIMTTRIAQHKSYPAKWPGMHAVGGIVGLVLLFFGLQGGGYGTSGWVAFGILAAALAGGAFLFGILFRGKRRPLFIALAHGSLGLTGIAVLAYSILSV